MNITEEEKKVGTILVDLIHTFQKLNHNTDKQTEEDKRMQAVAIVQAINDIDSVYEQRNESRD